MNEKWGKSAVRIRSRAIDLLTYKIWSISYLLDFPVALNQVCDKLIPWVISVHRCVLYGMNLFFQTWMKNVKLISHIKIQIYAFFWKIRKCRNTESTFSTGNNQLTNNQWRPLRYAFLLMLQFSSLPPLGTSLNRIVPYNLVC